MYSAADGPRSDKVPRYLTPQTPSASHFIRAEFCKFANIFYLSIARPLITWPYSASHRDSKVGQYSRKKSFHFRLISLNLSPLSSSTTWWKRAWVDSMSLGLVEDQLRLDPITLNHHNLDLDHYPQGSIHRFPHQRPYTEKADRLCQLANGS
jgi:hypothetical protein